ncbi:hypothetical protein AeMF1_013257 [Aphanomyces euteiches]|nr:hypothetical protein AeMF1_013257 [Aphanomyces euteiches]KAH9183460.1 hypothetical protein AeNC1_014565 [Aphanomyces euteiches]
MGGVGSTEQYSGEQYSVEIPHSAAPGFGPIRVNPLSLPIAEHTCNLWDNFKLGVAAAGDNQYLGTRSRDASGKAGAYTWITYNQAYARILRISTGFHTLLKIQRQEAVGIFSKNRAEWILTEMACNRMSYTLVPLYDTLGPKVIPFILNHTSMRVLVCAAELIPNILAVKHECPTLEALVSFELVTSAQRAEAASKGIVLYSLDEIENVPDATVAEAVPKSTELATICYTSGTTGDPKGAMLTHGNITSGGISVVALDMIKPHSVHVSYLPLPHIFERIVTTIIARKGASMGFYQGDVAFLLDDMAELKPTIFVSVPRLFNRVYDKITQGIAAAGGVKKLMFDLAYESKRQALVPGANTHAFWDAIVFSKLKAVLGGRVEGILSGSAPLASNVKEFLQIVFGCEVDEGYGLTECCAVATLSTRLIPKGPHVGAPNPNVQIRLADVPEMNYTTADKPRPRGEVCLRGSNIFLGYYKDAEKTAECLTSDGWFYTGDIGAWNPDGTLSIIDRKKNIFKLSQGEYIAAEKIENVYAKSPFVAQIFLYGDSYQSCVVAIVVPDPEVVQSWATSQGIPEGNNLAKMAARPELKAAIVTSMDQAAKEGKLNGFECVKDIHLHPDVFSVENDLITPTFKLRRPQLKAYFKNQIDTMYAGLK